MAAPDTRQTVKGNRCSVCGQILEGKVTFAANKFWCQNHFTCSRCNITLREDRYNTFEEKAYCPKCFEIVRPKCQRCVKPVLTSQQFIKVGKFVLHNECFTCADCKARLDPAAFVFDNNALLCEACAIKRHEQGEQGGGQQ